MEQFRQPFCRLVTVTHESLRLVRRLPEAWDDISLILEDSRFFNSKPFTAKSIQDQTQDRALLAQSELDLDFPRLHAHNLPGVWGAQDASAKHSGTSRLISDPAILQNGRLKTKSSLGLSAEARSRIVDDRTLARELLLKARRRDWDSWRESEGPDPEPFECDLALVGLDGPIPRKVAENLTRSRAIRNVWRTRWG